MLSEYIGSLSGDSKLESVTFKFVLQLIHALLFSFKKYNRDSVC